MKRILSIALLLVWVTAGYGDELEIETLRGLEGIGVIVENLREDAGRERLTTTQVQTDVKLRLRKAGIRVLTEEQRLKTPGRPYLYVNVNARKVEQMDHYVYSIRVALRQIVSLERDPSITTVGETWDQGYLGITTTDEMPKDIRDDVGDFVDMMFINDYLTANPIERTK